MFILFLLKAGVWVVETETIEGRRRILAKGFKYKYKNGTWKLRK